MEDRLIFLYYVTRVINVVGTEKDIHGIYWMMLQAGRVFEEVKSLRRLSRNVTWWSRKTPEGVESMLPRKAAT